MISRLQGILLDKQPPQLLIDVNGVGYEVEAPMSTFYVLPELGKEITLLTHFSVREDAQQLYGFASSRERTLFRHLIKVNGVGPRLGLTVLSSLEPDHFVQAVANNDVAALVRVPGIGKKTAERLMIDMRDRLKDWDIDLSATVKNSDAGANTSAAMIQEATGALIALGYKPQEASRMIDQVDKALKTTEAFIRQALQTS